MRSVRRSAQQPHASISGNGPLVHRPPAPRQSRQLGSGLRESRISCRLTVSPQQPAAFVVGEGVFNGDALGGVPVAGSA